MTIRRWLGALAAVGFVLGFGVAAEAGATLDKVKQAGQISCGVATYAPGMDLEQLLSAADKGLYLQKSTPSGS